MIERPPADPRRGLRVDSTTTGTPALVADLTDPREDVAIRWPVFRNKATRIGARDFAVPTRIGAIGLDACRLLASDTRSAEPRQDGLVGPTRNLIHSRPPGLAHMRRDDRHIEAPASPRGQAENAFMPTVGQARSSFG